MATEKLLPAVAETLHASPRREISFYVVLLVAVLPIWSIVPLSWAFVAYALHYRLVWTFSWPGWSLFAVALSEVFFSIYYHNLAVFISGPSPNGRGNLSELRAVFHRVLKAGLASLPEEGYDEDEETLDVDRPGSPEEAVIALEFDDPRAVDFRNYLRTWFRRVPWSHIHRQEMFAWLYWSVFNAPFEGMDKVSQMEQKVLHEVIELIECRAGINIPEGSNPAVNPLLLTLDPVDVAWRPLVWYLGVALSNAILRRRLRTKWNAKVGTYKGLEYVLRIPSSWNARTGPRPLVFMHGLGLGLTQYCSYIEQMYISLPDHPILVPLLPHVSQEIFHPRFLTPMGRKEMTECLAGLIAELGWADPGEPSADSEGKGSNDAGRRGVTMFSHSNGSFSHAWMLKAHPKMIARSCFVDPVTFCSWEGDMCYNFAYRPCATGLELVVRYFVGTELGVANFLRRHFDWSSKALWYEDIPHARDSAKTIFFLGGKDTIIDAHRVKRYLSSHGVRKGLRFDPAAHHGEALLSRSPFYEEILRWLREDK
ncbi:hypothetical protein C8Q80DRAFT_1153583 [Daedaleopsis nitida]|nr:hypothetical protein C8Q80DRAFT_1153583 [Daedaleopsis nitida]